MIDEWRGWWLLRSDHTLWRGLEPILDRSSSTGCTFHELATLYQHVVTYRPTEILELGAGISTIVLGYAAKQICDGGGACHLTSLEESEFYYNDLLTIVPHEILQYVDIILSPVEDRDAGDGRIGRHYIGLPKHRYDLVFVDGPQVPEAKRDPRYFDSDLLDTLRWNDDAFVAYVDGRQTTRDNLQRLMPWADFTYNKHHRFTRIQIPAENERAAA